METDGKTNDAYFDVYLPLLREKLAGAAVGDCGRLKEGVFVKDPQLTRLRRQKMRALRERLLSGKKKENKG